MTSEFRIQIKKLYFSWFHLIGRTEVTLFDQKKMWEYNKTEQTSTKNCPQYFSII